MLMTEKYYYDVISDRPIVYELNGYLGTGQ